MLLVACLTLMAKLLSQSQLAKTSLNTAAKFFGPNGEVLGHDKAVRAAIAEALAIVRTQRDSSIF